MRGWPERGWLSTALRGPGGTRVGVLVIGRVVCPVQRRVYQATGGRVTLTGRAPVLLLTTTGGRSGLPRPVPLFYLRKGNRLVVRNVNPGLERPNPWILNLRADPRAQVRLGPNVLPVSAREATTVEIDRYWPPLTRLWPAYQRFHDDGGAHTVFVLEPNAR